MVKSRIEKEKKIQRSVHLKCKTQVTKKVKKYPFFTDFASFY